MIPLTDKGIKFYERRKVCQICKGGFCYDKNKESKLKFYHKVRDHWHYTRKFRGAVHNICNLRKKVAKKIPVIFHNGSTYDYHFIFKQLAEEVKGQFECLGENTEKYISFSVPIKKEHDNGRKKEDDDSEKEEDDNSNKKKTITYILNFIDSYRFMQSELSDLADNLSGIFNKECKSCMERKKNKSECGFIGLKNNWLN